MSIKYTKSAWVYALAFIFAVCAAVSQDAKAADWVRRPAGYIVIGLTATGLLKAQKNEPDKPK